MKLGIEGKHALVWGGSKGIGFACARALALEGCRVTIAARTASTLQHAVAAILQEISSGSHSQADRPTPSIAPINGVVADLRTDAGRRAALAACIELAAAHGRTQGPDILINNADGPRVAHPDALTREDWLAAFDPMALGPIEMIKLVLDDMQACGFGRIVNITSRSVKASHYELGLSNGVRSVLTGFIAGLARTTIKHGVTINNLLPGIFATDAQRHHVLGLVEQTGRPFDTIWAERAAGNPTQRYGEPTEIGALCAYLCSAQAGFLTGQNMLIDGGGFPGTL